MKSRFVKFVVGVAPPYLTKNKPYEVTVNSYLGLYGDIVDDNGDTIRIGLKMCGHLNGKAWLGCDKRGRLV